MDLYEYLFEKLNLKLIEVRKVIQDYKPSFSIISYQLMFNDKLVWDQIVFTSAKDIFKYLVNSIDDQDKWITSLHPVVNLLRQFPKELESKEHVDMLLTLNGLNES